MANKLDYEPVAVMDITYDLDNQLRNINTSIMQDESMSLKDKFRQMRDFVMEWIDRFKRKEAKQMEIQNFKTNCALKFIGMMKKWLGNWDLKQEYLVGLRKEFAVKNNDINDALKKVEEAKLCQDCEGRVRSVLTSIGELYHSVE